MMPIINDVVEVCPQALVLNFTNPESRICLAINKLTELDAVGICHGTQGTCEIASRMMGKEPNDLEFLVGGINHFHWILGVNDVNTGKDMMPALNKAIAEDETVIQPLARFLHKTFGLLTFPFDSHIGEYVGFAYDMVGPKFENYRRRHIRVRETGDASSLPVWQEIQEVASLGFMLEQLEAPRNFRKCQECGKWRRLPATVSAAPTPPRSKGHSAPVQSYAASPTWMVTEPPAGASSALRSASLPRACAASSASTRATSPASAASIEVAAAQRSR